MFLRVAVQARQLGGLCPGLLLFIRTRLGPWLSQQGQSYAVGKVGVDELLRRVRCAELVLASGRSGSTEARARPEDAEQEDED